MRRRRTRAGCAGEAHLALCLICLGLLGCGDGDPLPDAGAGDRDRDRDRADASAMDGDGDDGDGAPGDAGGGEDPGSDGPSDAGAGDPPEEDPYANVDCAEVIVNQPPSALSCAGLYRDIVDKDLASGVRPFTPAYLLWSDGAEKQRWVFLPEGGKIDNSDDDAWQLPNGTKLFKEFKWKGRRVETRMFWKNDDGRWLKTAYHWNPEETEAVRFDGGDVDVEGDAYYIPSAKECDQCHKGRADRALGFERVLLSLAGAEGVTLKTLVEEDLLTDPPSPDGDALGDDGSGNAVAALGYLHVNCGVSCHNGNPGSEGYSSDLRLRLPPEAVDGRAPTDFETLTTTIGVAATTPRWSGETRIIPGNPQDSLLYKLISMRDPNNPKDQMPPIASRVVDEEGIAAIEQWISGLPTP